MTKIATVDQVESSDVIGCMWNGLVLTYEARQLESCASVCSAL
jgi:hypothetical protein